MIQTTPTRRAVIRTTASGHSPAGGFWSRATPGIYGIDPRSELPQRRVGRGVRPRFSRLGEGPEHDLLWPCGHALVKKWYRSARPDGEGGRRTTRMHRRSSEQRSPESARHVVPGTSIRHPRDRRRFCCRRRSDAARRLHGRLERADMDALADLLRNDAILTMPGPWFDGQARDPDLHRVGRLCRPVHTDSTHRDPREPPARLCRVHQRSAGRRLSCLRNHGAQAGAGSGGRDHGLCRLEPLRVVRASAAVRRLNSSGLRDARPTRLRACRRGSFRSP